MNWRLPYYNAENNSVDWQKIENEFSWFAEMKNVPQDVIWHGEGNVMIHTKMVVEALFSLREFSQLNENEKHILVTATLMHDIEKRSTTTTEVIDGKERIISPNHAKKGEFTARTILYKDFAISFKIREQIAKLVRYHGFPIWAIEKENVQKSLIKVSLEVNTKLLEILAKADVLGRICSDKEELLLKIDLFKELCLENKCYGKSKDFETDFARYFYLNKENSFPDFVPFEESEFEVIMLSALPGSGKDYFVNKIFKDIPMLSLDEIRRKNKISPTDKKKNGWVIQEGKEQAKQYLRKKENFVFNATNLTKDMRGKWISLFKDYRAKVRIIYLEVPYKTLLNQNKNREYPIPETVLEKMISKVEIPSFEECEVVVFNT
ncbi:AAA family ATPase [Aureivirga sp. CE67]|uniref:AAA family ATPase n=1 Tax=Aureivirga sp. CE67 TaxID=1788983 RepID=UPI0018CA519B|nr:AAA family ATPase [Aureivirga sp. CE67]